MRRALAFLALAFVLAAILGCGETTGMFPGPTPTTNQVAFLQRPVPTPTAVQVPNMAPSADVKLMVMNVDGTSAQQVGPSGTYYAVDMSHDGKKLVFVENDTELGMQLYVATISTTSATNITPAGTSPEMPEFSPDGSKVYFVNTDSTPWEIWSVNVDGSNPLNLSDEGVTCMHEVTVAPNGTLFFHGHSEAGSGIFTMSGTGGPVTLIIDEYAYHPSVTPDGTKLVFELDAEGSVIATSTLTGTNIQPLTTAGSEYDPIVIGDKILYISNASSNPEVFSMDLNGTNQTRLTNNTALDWFGEFWD